MPEERDETRNMLGSCENISGGENLRAYQDFLRFAPVLHPEHVHAQRNLIPFGPQPEDLVAEAAFLLLACAEPLLKHVEAVQSDRLRKSQHKPNVESPRLTNLHARSA